MWEAQVPGTNLRSDRYRFQLAREYVPVVSGTTHNVCAKAIYAAPNKIRMVFRGVVIGLLADPYVAIPSWRGANK